MDFISKNIQDYCQLNSSKEHLILEELSRETHLKHLSPRMLSGHIQGNFLSILSSILQPKAILEIGTYTGYSAICLASGLTAEGKLITIDINEELENTTRKYFQKSNYHDRIDFRIGNALSLIPQLNEKFDLVFIDADKKNYLNYFNLVKPILTNHGVIIADNVLWSGKCADESFQDSETNCLREYNRVVSQDVDFDSVLLPIRDGLMISRKK